MSSGTHLIHVIVVICTDNYCLAYLHNDRRYFKYHYYMCCNLDHFLSRVMEYREEMTEMTSSLKQNMKMMRKKIKHFFVESSE